MSPKSERKRAVSESEGDKKRSKFNLKLERVSSNPPSNKSKALSAAGASLKSFFSRKKSKSSKENRNGSFINPIASAEGHHVPGFVISPTEEEMQERKSPSGEEEAEICLPAKNPCSCTQPNQRLVSVPRTLPHDRIAFAYNQEPLQNFRLEGTAPPYPGRKLIFRPSAYRDGQPVYNGSVPINRAYPPPPRMMAQMHENPSLQNARPPQCPNTFPSNFPNHHIHHHANPVRRLPISSAEMIISAKNSNGNSCNNPEHLHRPIPKQRRSLIQRQNQVSPEIGDEHYWILPPEGCKCSLQQTHNVSGLRHVSSCVNLSPSSNNSDSGISAKTSSVVRKSSSQSRLSSCVSKNDFRGSSSVPWFRWFASRLEKDGHQGSTASSPPSLKSGVDADGRNKNCIRCNKKLSTATKGLKGVIRAPISCSVCSLLVCSSSCAVYDPTRNSYSCGHCHPPKSADKRKNFWFDKTSPGLNGPGTSFLAAERDTTTEEVREHLERIIEAELGVDEGIDSVSLARLFNNKQYDLLFQTFHGTLSDSLCSLGLSLKLAIENKPIPAEETVPTNAHASLKQLLVDIKEIASELPTMETVNKTEENEPTDPAISNNNGENKQVQPSYEDVLATAVINKAVLNGQKQKRKVDSPMSLVDSAVQTDSEMSESSEVNSHKHRYKDVHGWITNLEKTPPQQHPNLSDDDLSMGTNSSWSNDGKANQQVVIEEQVEEITTTYESDSDLSRTHPPRSRKGRKTARQRNNEQANGTATVVQEDAFLDVDLSNFDAKVPFPEGGVDIVPRSKLGDEEEEDDDDDPTGKLISQISEWEQNWLFKRRKQLLRRRNLMAEAVPMLVPMPNTDDDSEPKIGDDKVSYLSDLSDHANDNDDLSDFTSSEEEEGAEEEAQNEECVVIKTVAAEVETIPTHKEILTSTPNTSVINGNSTELPRKESSSSISSRASAISSTTPSVNGTPKKQFKSADKPPKKVVKRPVDEINFLKKPEELVVKRGTTARFACIVTEDSPDFSVAWFFDGLLITTREGKSWVYSCGKTQHYLYLYDSQESDSGKYHVSLFDYKGNEIKLQFALQVDGTYRKRPEPPNFTLLQDTVNANKSADSIIIPFEVSGYPEPFLQVFRNEIEISKLAHVLLEDKGNGQWSLELRKKQSGFTVYGEYVAVVRNAQGITRVTFRVQECEGRPSITLEDTKIIHNGISNGHLKHSELELTPEIESPSHFEKLESSTEETMRDQTHTINRNKTVIKEDYDTDAKMDSEHKMTVAEKEKLKWMNPVKLPNNPYAPENLAKRISQRDSGSFQLHRSPSAEVPATSSDDEKNVIAEKKQNLSKFARDYYVHGVKAQTPKAMNFGSSRSISSSIASISSREGSNEKELDNISTASATSPVPAKRSPVPTRQNGTSATATTNGTGTSKGNNLLSPDRTPSPQSSTSRTPSPRPRRYNSDMTSITAYRETTPPKLVKLPSVKQLAQQFQVEEKVQPPQEIKSSQQSHQPRVFVPPKEPKNYQQVHSLTARSVSKEFRDGLKLPLQSDINIKLKKAPEKQSNNKELKLSEFKSDSENLNSEINGGGTRLIESDSKPGDLNRKKGGSSSNILARAAFWDKRVQEGIVDDDLVIKEFPKVV